MLIEDSGNGDGDAWIRAEREHERATLKMKNFADQDRRQSRNQMIGYIATALAAVLIVASIAALIYGWQRDSGQRGQELEMACTETGGTWTTIGGGQTKVCVHLSKVPQ